MPEFNYILLTGGIVCSCIIMVLLLVFGRNRLANLFLNITIFALAWYAMIYVLVLSGGIRQVPDLYNKGIPLYYLIAPCCYLYLFFSLYPDRKFAWKDALHFLPALLAVADVVPYAIAAHHEKLQLLDRVSADVSQAYQHTLSLIPQQFHYVARFLQAVVYVVLQWYLLVRLPLWQERPPYLRKWLYNFTILISLLNMLQGLIMAGIVLFPDNADHLLQHSMPIVGMCVVFFLTSVILFFKPKVLYGLPDRSEMSGVVTSRTTVARRAPAPTPHEDWNKITVLMEEKQLFRQEGLTLHQLSVAAGIQAHQLSEMLSVYQKQHFNTYVNSWRVRYVIDRIQQGDSKILTLESLAKDAGFTSRNTFHTAFKRETGMTPTRYIASRKSLTVT